MSGRVLLDTNIVIAIFAEEPPVLDRMAAAEEVFVPAVALGELYYGARKSGRTEANIARIDEFAAAAAILGCDALTAQRYGRIKNDLRAKGRPIPENDIWIGAVGMQHGLTVATRDHDHFSQISGLAVEVW
jgi:tRNA(fMet)-specific endonuclease VapC